jgi:hypothetical protein
MSKNLLFSFEDMGLKSDKATRNLVKYFARAGNNVAQGEAIPAIKRTAGISYREMVLTFADSQTVILRIKQSGDIYQVLLNDRVIPIKAQDDHVSAIAEIVRVMDSGRKKFQDSLVKLKAKLPAGIRTAAPKMEAVLTEKRDGLKEAVASVRAQIEALAA